MDAAMLLDGIRDGDRHAGGIRCRRLFRLQPTFLTELQGEVKRFCGSERPSLVTRAEHATSWTGAFGEVLQFSLLNRSGQTEDFSSDHDLSCLGKCFHQAAAYPALARLIKALPHTVNVRINLLGPRSGLPPHEEHALIRTNTGAIGARIRFHLPVITAPGAELMLDGNLYHLEEGVLHFVNHGCVHAATNRGNAARIHLVWDMLLTRTVFDQMFQGGAALALPLYPVCDRNADPTTLRTGRTGAYRKLPPMVSPADAVALGFCDIQ